jgi:hypothetical protein
MSNGLSQQTPSAKGGKGKILELHLNLVFRFGIGRYFPGILPTNTVGKLGQGILVSYIWREPLFSPQREASAPFFW